MSRNIANYNALYQNLYNIVNPGGLGKMQDFETIWQIDDPDCRKILNINWLKIMGEGIPRRRSSALKRILRYTSILSLPLAVLAQNPSLGMRVMTYVSGTIAGGTGYAVLRIPGDSGDSIPTQILYVTPIYWAQTATLTDIRLYSGSTLTALLYITFLTKCWLSPKERVLYLVVSGVLTVLLTALFSSGTSNSPLGASS